MYIVAIRTYILYCPDVTPPLFATYFQEKEGGGGVITRTCAFASQLSPPPPPLPRIRVLCSAVEDSFDRHAVAVLKDGRVVGLGRDGRMTASGNRPRSAKKAKTSSQTIFYTLDTQVQLFYTCNTRTRAELQYGKLTGAARGGGGGV